MANRVELAICPRSPAALLTLPIAAKPFSQSFQISIIGGASNIRNILLPQIRILSDFLGDCDRISRDSLVNDVGVDIVPVLEIVSLASL